MGHRSARLVPAGHSWDNAGFTQLAGIGPQCTSGSIDGWPKGEVGRRPHRHRRPTLITTFVAGLPLFSRRKQDGVTARLQFSLRDVGPPTALFVASAHVSLRLPWPDDVGAMRPLIEVDPDQPGLAGGGAQTVPKEPRLCHVHRQG